MKIIATKGSDVFLVEATDTELARISGYSYPRDAKEKGVHLDIGREIKVNDLWEVLNIARSRMTTIAGIATSLRGKADEIDKINATLKSPVVECKA